MIGVYRIFSKDKSYIGSSIDIENRIKAHFQSLRQNNHDNTDLQLDFNKESNSFSWEILEECFELELLNYERKWFNFIENKYNKTPPHQKIEITKNQEKLFWSKIDIKNNNECWNWSASIDKDNYGRISFNKDGKKKTYRANRLAYFLTYPNSNIDLIVRHKCNNSKCCNPNHLCLGSYSENRKDVANSNKFKLTWNNIKQLRNYFLINPNIHRYKLRDWAKNEFNYSFSSNYLIDICMNKKWRDKEYIPPYRFNIL